MKVEQDQDDPDDDAGLASSDDYVFSIERPVNPAIFGAVFVLFSRITSPAWSGNRDADTQSSKQSTESTEELIQRGMNAALSVLVDLEVPVGEHLAYVYRLMSALDVLNHPSLIYFRSQSDLTSIDPKLLDAMATVGCSLLQDSGFQVSELLREIERDRSAEGDGN